MKNNLQNIASLSSGVYTQFGQFGSAIYLQSNFFDAYGVLDSVIKPNLVLNPSLEKHVLSPGDILFAAKGANNFAVTIKDTYGPCVASSTFIVIKIAPAFKHKIMADYLAWYINQPHVLAYIKNLATGSGVQSISIAKLQDLEIEIPSLKIQENIIAIDYLYKKEKQLKKQIETLRNKQMHYLLMNVTKEPTYERG